MVTTDQNITRNQITIVCAVITDSEGKVLLVRRNDPGSNEHQKLEFPGGKIGFGEDATEAVVREAKEETNLDIEVTRLLPKIYTNIFPPNANHKSEMQCILLCYEAKVIGGSFTPQAEEIIDGKFYSRDEIDYSQTVPKTKEIIELLDK